MDVVTAVVADEQPLEVVKVGEGTFDHPTVAAQAGAVPGVAAGDLWCDAAPAQLAAVAGRVVAAVGGDPVGAATRPADLAPDGRDAVEQRDQLGDVVAVSARDRPGERDPCRVDEKVMLGAVSASINRARARRGAPFFA